jgi:general secretion pathway protein G
VARGFTIVVLLVTLVIVSILAAAAFPMAELVVVRERERDLRRDLMVLRDAIDAYKQAYDDGRIAHSPGASGYPPSLHALVDGVPDASRPDAARIVFLRRIPRDPLASAAIAPEDSWGKRAYASSASEPMEGEDVYDVYSRSPGVGMNGVPYAQW